MAKLQSSISTSSEISSSGSDPGGSGDFSSPEEELLYYARNGYATDIENLLQSCADKDVKLNINCKGNKKSNRGWTPLHLAAYFGHTAVVRTLLEAGAEVNTINSSGDTPLHRAAYTGREDVVGLLLEFGADITTVNSEGHRPKDVTRREHVLNMLDAAATHEARLLHEQLLNAAATGNMELLHSVMLSKSAPSIVCKDQFGNTALHHAAMHGHAEVAVYLLQNGIDPDIRNIKGQTACDVAHTPHMKQVLGVQPIKTLKLHPQRFEGPLNKKSRFTGFKSVWVVLERGVLSYFQTRGDACTGTKRKGMKYLDEARLWVSESAPQEIKVYFSDGVVHTLSLENSSDLHIHRQKWMNALNEHIAFSTHYTHKGEQLEDEEEEMMPLGTMQDSLQTAQAHQKILEKQCTMLKNTVDTLEHFILKSPSANAVAKSNNSTAAAVVRSQEHEYLRSIQVQASELLKSSRDMCASLSHCMMLFNQQEEMRQMQLKEQTEKCRVLQDSLHALAAEHHELERSIQRRPSMTTLRDEDEFYDCDDDSYGSYLPEKFADALSQDIVFDDVDHSESPVVTKDGQCIRTHLPVPMFSRADFSVWSILKQCIGKELSKITMPVIFNEPLSFLQRITEYLEYAQLLQTAAQTDDPLLRMQYVAAFAVSAISSNWERIGKPFNPLLGETYELERRDLGFRLMSEQVSHHPPISAFHVEGDSYSINGSVLPKLRFWGKSVEITPKGTVTLSLPKYNEVYTWQNVNCCIHNVIVGKLWVEHSGTMEITNHQTKMKAVLNFKQCGWFGKDLHKVEGFIYGPRKQKLKALYGNWVLGMFSADVDEYESAMKPNSRDSSHSNSFSKQNGASSKDNDVDDSQPTTAFGAYELDVPSQVCLWRASPRPPHSSKYFCFTSFAMTLNQLMDGQEAILPPTDSRLRPDIRMLEEGNIDGAAEQKNRLEEKQRAARKDRKKSKQEWTPAWFSEGTNPHTGCDDWTYNGKYFNRSWSSCPDIF